jgi:hypothetical protein
MSIYTAFAFSITKRGLYSPTDYCEKEWVVFCRRGRRFPWMRFRRRTRQMHVGTNISHKRGVFGAIAMKSTECDDMSM